jgi:RNA-binding protein YlmH
MKKMTQELDRQLEMLKRIEGAMARKSTQVLSPRINIQTLSPRTHVNLSSINVSAMKDGTKSIELEEDM